MVEGPGTTRNSQKASRLINGKVLNITTSHPIHEPWWTDRILSQVIKIGKELFLVFSLHDNDDANQNDNEDLALRLHFGMNGSLQINNLLTSMSTSSVNHESYRGRGPPTLEITFTSKILRAYQTTISTAIPAKAPRSKFQALHSHDVCSPTFNLSHVIKLLQSPKLHVSKETVISDILLDQRILPGIGNIIKVEGMHEAKIHPNRPLSSLTHEELSFCILCCKEYSMRWLNTGKSPAKFVYNQTICGSCAGSTVRMCRVGGTNRTTFWCSNCQKMDPTEDDALREVDVTLSFSSSASSAVGSIGNGIVSNSMPVNNGNINKSNPSLEERSMNTNQNPNPNPTNVIKPNQTTTHKPACICPSHGPSTIILRRCKKKTMNEQRIFYTCTRRGCNFFKWADGGFPFCQCKKRAVLRVSKTQKTGGRWFFFCANRSAGTGTHAGGGGGRGCGYFQWADRKYLDRYGHLLTPLL